MATYSDDEFDFVEIPKSTVSSPLEMLEISPKKPRLDEDYDIEYPDSVSTYQNTFEDLTYQSDDSQESFLSEKSSHSDDCSKIELEVDASQVDQFLDNNHDASPNVNYLRLLSNERYVVAKMSDDLQDVENFVVLQPERQFNADEVYLELCSYNFDASVEEHGYVVQMIDLTMPEKGPIQYDTDLKLDKRIHIFKVPNHFVPILILTDQCDCMSLDVDLSDTVSDLKQSLRQILDVEGLDFDLIFQNKVLIDMDLLCFHYIMKACMIMSNL